MTRPSPLMVLSCVLVLAAGCSANRPTDVVVTPSELFPTTVALTWNTAEAGRSWVEFGIEDLDRRVDADDLTANHEVRLAGLKPGKTYRYQAFTEVDGTARSSRVGELQVAGLPAELPRLVADPIEPDAVVRQGHVLTSIIEGIQGPGGFVVVLDGDGDIVWWFDTGHAGSIPEDLAEFGVGGWSGRSLPLSSAFDASTQSYVFLAYDLEQSVDVAVLRRIPVDAMSYDDVVVTRLPSGHHDFVFHPEEAAVGYLAYQIESVDGDLWAADAIVETAEASQSPGAVSRVWTWHDDGPDTPSVLHGSMVGFDFPGAEFEWSHSNSLMYNAEADAYFVMSKFLDCLVKIDRSTGRLDWILGGPYSDFTLADGESVWSLEEGTPDSRLWSHSHMSDLWYDPATGTGGFVVFDNGDYRSTQVQGRSKWSRLAEFSFDERAGEVQETWSFVHPSGAHTTLLGDLDRLTEDRYLASWSLLDRGLEEIDLDGNPQWRVRPRNSNYIMGRAVFIDSLDVR